MSIKELLNKRLTWPIGRRPFNETAEYQEWLDQTAQTFEMWAESERARNAAPDVPLKDVFSTWYDFNQERF